MYFVITLSCKENNVVNEILLITGEIFIFMQCSPNYSKYNTALLHCLFIYSFISSRSTGICGPRLCNGEVWLLIYCSMPPCWHTELMGMIPFWIPLGTEFKNCIVCLKYPNYRVLINHGFDCVQFLPLVALVGSVLLAVNGFGLMLVQRSFS